MLMSVWHCTTPENFARAESTLTMPAVTVTLDAWISTLDAATTVTPALANSAELPLASSTRTVPGPSLSVMRCPPGVSAMNCSWPDWSSRVMVTPFFDRIFL